MKFVSLLPAVIFFLTVSQFSYSQNFTINDSVDDILKSGESDSLIEKKLLDIIKKKDGQPIERLLVARRLLSFSEKKKNIESQALALEHISIAQRNMGDYASAIKSSLDALRIYDKLNLPEKVAALQLQIGSHFTAEKNFSKARQYMNKGLESLYQQQDSSQIVLALINLGETYRLNGKPDSAALLFKECLELNQLYASPRKQVINAYAEGNLGMVFSTQGKDQEAIKLLKSSINTLGE
ncbi:MAG: tetratricopeptide repeat protein, partial [Nanoarchaeota archaeon]